MSTWILYGRELMNTRYIIRIYCLDFDQTLIERTSWSIIVKFNDGSQRTFSYKTEEERDLNFGMLRKRITPLSLNYKETI